ncbi:MAG: FKBP-type peptidyl-prolyl cis-trans isomerase, partial [Bacteroidales bacterium]|nr:FKBP-type peptidyl-prolyl cis-trans isomerase [Bacteroidales bacterium]
AELNQKTGEKFLDANKMKDGVVVTESGLQYKIIEAGNDVKAGPVDTVYVHYTGTLIDGTEFDASDRAGEPVKMFMNRVIKGWTEGLQLVGEGGRIQLFIPADLAYGARKMGKIEANSTLIFDVDVVKVGKVPATEEE